MAADHAHPPIAPRLRWSLFTVLCIAGVFNAMDRPIIAILKPDMMADFGWTDSDFGDLAAVTQFSAAFAFLFTGWLVDRLGVNRSMQVGASAWSLAAMAHGWAMTTWQVVAARVGLGVTEAVQTPLTIKTVAALFPPDTRSFAFGFATMLAGAGTIAMPFLIPLLATEVGWRGALVAGGIGGFLSLLAWIWLAHGVQQLRNDPATAEQRPADAPATDRYGAILANRQTWGIVVAKAISDMTWWFINFWLADYYRKEFGLSTLELAVPLAIAFAGSGLGALLAGWASTRLLERGVSPDRVRKGVMLVSALIVAPLPLALQLDSFWPVAVMIGLVMAGHQGFSLSIFSTITDVVPQAKVGRVTAFGAFMGNMGGVAISLVTGRVLDAGLGYVPLFVFAAASYLIALAWFRLLIPVIRRPEEEEARADFA
ncbi:MFS transporter [Porphyrobacter sp. CACIAM 03H1]|uniref:MFS transporter n=1 Tax=Porphyrobacter sp. CACIAM 03H1 TaxID=2003315 RepID=UPI000B5A57DB|nr:MFS transporter [Porphyrobacter sp. CACIAM 03H1]ASJ90485.1 MFS transporter [Porphyrobacter sp. CACIAM 03H1]